MEKKFPKKIPIFPLSGVIYFPRTNLPLNIFEERYLDLVNDSFRSNKLMGMVQSKKENNLVYKVGCLGKINDYQETSDGRILINLTGATIRSDKTPTMMPLKPLGSLSFPRNIRYKKDKRPVCNF